MGCFSDHYKQSYKGHVVEVEARVLSFLCTVQYDLIVDDKRVDRIEGMFGKFSLRTFVEGSESAPELIKIEIKQSMFGIKYYFCVGTERQRMAKA